MAEVQKKKPVARTKKPAKPLPPTGNPENMVDICGTMVEIKPVKVKYMRDYTAAFYRAVDTHPMPDLYMMKVDDEGERDADKAMVDWLIAATDNAKLILEKYEEMDSEMIERILEIYKRVNRIAEKEEKLKKFAQERGVRG